MISQCGRRSERGFGILFLSKLFHDLLLLALVVQSGSNDATVTDNCNPQEGTCKLYPILGQPTETTESTQGLKLALRRWLPPETEAKAVVLFHHGGAGFHSGYSDIMGQALSQQGIAVVAYDQAGSGYSEGARGYFDSIDTVCDDYSKVLAQDKLEAGTKGTLADGYILTGPVINLLPEMLPPRPVIHIIGFLSRFFPMLHLPGTDFFSTFDLAFGDKAWAQTGRNDPFVQEAAKIRPRLGMASSMLSKMTKLNQSFQSVRVPLKILVGEREGRLDVDAIHQLSKEASSTDKDLEVVPGGYHQLFQDVPEVTSKVCNSVASWILQRV